jgi:environmental stress-induced protein Ves
MRILRSQDYRRMRWKNGGGQTTEIIVSPDGAALDAFAWRVSMAQVASDGPFSLFPNIDRTLAVLSGNGIMLRVDGIGTVDLTTVSAPFAFPADVAAGANLLDGPIRDLNVMSRRGAYRHTLTQKSVNAPYPLNLEGHTMLLLVEGGDATIQSGTQRETLADGDSIVLDKTDAGAVLTPASSLTLYIAEFRRA